MEEDFDIIDDENDEPEATRNSAQEIFDTWKDQLKFFRSLYYLFNTLTKSFFIFN